ncbi:MAG: hypothetical protein K2X87_15110 [Gemmataceae bacterium]|nr:hypothetical protein [Gemmataceae bacterium]
MGRAGLIVGLVGLLPAGCGFGPRALEKTHGRYNEAYLQVDSEELLRNIVRLRYGDPPAEVEVSGIAAQYELSAQAEARPFFIAPNPSNSNIVFRTFTSILPAGTAGSAERPTVTLTPVHSGEIVARYMRPIAPDGVVFLAETSWPISTIFRLWLEGMNGVPNAPSASGPTRSFPPEYADFRRAADLLQAIQDRGELTFRKVEEEVPGDPIALDRVSGEALVEARKAGCEYRLTTDRAAWQLVHKARRLYLDLSPRTLGTPEYAELVGLLNLRPGLTRYEVTQSTVGFIEQRPDAPPSDKLALVTRSLLQVFFYLAHGVEVPAELLADGAAKPTLGADGRPFDWQQVTGGLFTVRACPGKKPPAGAAVAVRHRGYWFYLDDADHASKSTFVLMRPSRHLDFGPVPSDKRAGPVLTLPVGR